MKDETRSFYESAVHGAVTRIFARLDEALDLAALARHAALSPLHFHRIFRGVLGETPLAMHRRIRLERAAHELAAGDAPVTRIAFAAGYETHESFTRAFAEHYGASPSAFRQKIEEARAGCARPPQLELAARSGLHFRPGAAGPSWSIVKGDPAMNVESKTLPPLRVAAVRHVGAYNAISEAFVRLGELAGKAGLLGRPGTQMIALYHDDPDAVPVAELRSDAAVTVPEDAALPPGTTELRIPGGTYASTTHVGPYTGLSDAWAKLMGGWLPSSGCRIGEGPSFEIYRNTPMTAPPEELVTELYVPIV